MHTAATGCLKVLQLLSRTTTNMKLHIIASCPACNYQIGFFSEPHESVVGKAASFASAAAGMSCEQLIKFLCLLGVKPMDAGTHRRQMAGCKDAVREVLEQAFEENREVEKQLAVAKGNVGDDGIPEPDAVCDGGYSMMNKCKKFAGTSCAVGTTGAESLLLMDLHVGNTRCGVCTTAKRNKQQPPASHVCSITPGITKQNMEQQLTLQSFRDASQKHNIRYKRLIADSDTSVYSELRKSNSYAVGKLDCTDHSIRSLRCHLFSVSNL
jgi:hypothetical protein